MFDPRWELQFPSTLIYYNHDNGNPWMKGIERHQTAAAYWQQAYHTTCADLSEAVYLLQCRISDLEERFADKKQTKEEWRPTSPSTPTAIKLPNDVQGNFV
ncbi:hypothetical protein SGCOL_006997 [Colletotrichum sp. CLE4]